AEAGAKLKATLRTLRQESTAVRGDPDREIGPPVDALARALEEKLALVEYFKSDNALLQNSSTYFAHAGPTVGERVLAGSAAPPAEITALSQAVLRFMQSPEAAVGQEARRALERLSRVPSLRADGEALALATHGGLIVEVLPQVDALLRQIVAVPVMAEAEAVRDVVFRRSNLIQARAQVVRGLLYVVAGLLLGSLLFPVCPL